MSQPKIQPEQIRLSLNELNDVNVSTPATEQVLLHNGSAFVNKSLNVIRPVGATYQILNSSLTVGQAFLKSAVRNTGVSTLYGNHPTFTDAFQVNAPFIARVEISAGFVGTMALNKGCYAAISVNGTDVTASIAYNDAPTAYAFTTIDFSIGDWFSFRVGRASGSDMNHMTLYLPSTWASIEKIEGQN